jgi:flavin reductase (DIM6/NTAB) family NADH-FMN oxidoreductase RutF
MQNYYFFLNNQNIFAKGMRKQTGNFDLFRETTEKLSGDGALLVAGTTPNPMTIGWGTLGVIWGIPVFQVYVRPNRFTFGLMEAASEFSICFFSDRYAKELAICGTRSGRDIDKIASCSFSLEKGILISTPHIRESLFHYECRIIHKHRLDPDTLDKRIIKRYYPKRDFHMVYYGEILGTFRSEH